jgi:hypothetical protein
MLKPLHRRFVTLHSILDILTKKNFVIKNTVIIIIALAGFRLGGCSDMFRMVTGMTTHVQIPPRRHKLGKFSTY